MSVNTVPKLGWTRGDVAATILLVTAEQREQIAMRVRSLMEDKGYTNARLAYKAGLSEKTVSRVINARKESRYETLDRIAKALGTSERELRDAPHKLTDGDAPDRLSGIEDQLEQLRLQLAAHDVEVLKRLDAMLEPARASRTRRPA